MGSAGAGAFSGAVGLAVKGNTSKKGLIMALAGITFSAALLVFSVSRISWLSYAMLFLAGFGAINMIATANSILQLSVPDALRGRVMGSFTTMFLGMSPLGHLSVGSLAHYGIMEVDSDSTPKYYGYEAANGAWYIMKETASGGDTNFRYIKGSINFATNWTNRASLSYDTFANTF